MDDYKGYCKGCNAFSSIVLDHRTGDTICSDCGLVLESHYIDECSEWRNFNDDNNDKDPNRVGRTTNPLLTLANLITKIEKKPTGSNCDGLLSKLQNHLPNPDRNLILGFQAIETIASRLSLVGLIQDRANEIYKKVGEKRCCNVRNREAMSAACLFIGSKEVKLPRTLSEIAGAAHGVTKKEINKALNIIKRNVELEVMGSTNPTELVRRFCSNLGMKNQDVKAVKEAVEKIQEIDIRRNPKSVLAAIIYIISQLSDEKKPLREVSLAADVAVGTIIKSYKDLCPYASRLIPTWYATEEDIKNLTAH